jgi:hypothetical protein
MRSSEWRVGRLVRKAGIPPDSEEWDGIEEIWGVKSFESIRTVKEIDFEILEDSVGNTGGVLHEAYNDVFRCNEIMKPFLCGLGRPLHYSSGKISKALVHKKALLNKVNTQGGLSFYGTRTVGRGRPEPAQVLVLVFGNFSCKEFRLALARIVRKVATRLIPARRPSSP